jgi:thiamine-phosphate pyrophosphorylase
VKWPELTTDPVLPFPVLYAIVDVEVCARAGRRAGDVARAYLSGGARLLQLRAKDLASGAFLELAAGVVSDARAVHAQVIINDRADIAVLASADGVHVGQDDLLPEDVRTVAGPDRIVGLSTHTTDQIDAALRQPITYLAIGPIFSTITKATGYDALGYAAVAAAARLAAAAKCPVVAIGGITLETAPRVIEAGAASVAIITDLLNGDPEVRVREYLSALQ